MAENFALHEGAFGRIVLLSLRAGLVPHAHSDAHIVWWLGGAEAEARIGTQEFRYSDTAASAVNPFEQHDLKLLSDTAPAIFLAVYVNMTWLDRKAGIAGRPFVFASPRINIGSELRAALWQLLDLMMTRPEHHAAIDTAVERAIDMSIESSRTSASAAAPVIGPVLSRPLRLAIGLMREHLEIRLTVDDIASQAGVSRARLFALFRDQLNTTPQIFWSAIRLEAAIRKLASGDMALMDVAHDLGFSAASNFSRFFKEHSGISPSDYRRAARTAPPADSPRDRSNR
jgi:AraC-like DNA-binding protein